MPDERDLNLHEYDISTWAYRELKAFCRQYPEKLEKLKALRGISGVSYEGGGSKSSEVSDPTYAKAAKSERLRADCELIEQTAIEAGGELYKYLIKNVTEGVGYFNLDMPTDCNHKFYRARKKFFYLLAIKRNIG